LTDRLNAISETEVAGLNQAIAAACLSPVGLSEG
jgi:hypothetical protein